MSSAVRISEPEPPGKEGKYVFPPGLKVNLLLYSFNRFRHGDPIRVFQHLADTYGDIAHYKLGRQHVVFLNSPEYVREVLVVQNANFVKERTVQRMKMLVGEGLITSEDPFHRKQRMLAQPAFYRQRIAAYADDIVNKAAAFRDRWSDGRQLDISLEMMHLTLDVIAKTLFDSDVAAEVEEISREVNAIMRLYNFLVLVPLAEVLQNYPLPGMRRFRRARSRLDAIVYRMIEEHRRDSRHGADLLSMLLSARYEDGSAMPDRQVRDEVMTIFLAGYETIANALTWTWYLLSQNSAAEEKLHDELATVLAGRQPTYDDLPKLSYTEMVLAESMRLYPPAWAMGRFALDDFRLGPYFLPKNTTVFTCQYVMHRDPRYFPDPERFDPERWRPEAKARRPRFSYFPFGGGARQCIGESFAWMEGVLILATLAQSWRLRLVSGHRVEPQPLITLRPKYGMKMTLEARR
ncbi:MAG: cytochrome P450 [Acidobacteria bacterium]|nr:cytochrome P450 [Acidobacteriota bacterium]